MVKNSKKLFKELKIGNKIVLSVLKVHREHLNNQYIYTWVGDEYL